jgi:hypothetical protein
MVFSNHGTGFKPINAALRTKLSLKNVNKRDVAAAGDRHQSINALNSDGITTGPSDLGL